MRTFSLFLALAALASSVLASSEAPLAGRATPVAAQFAVQRSEPTPELDRRQVSRFDDDQSQGQGLVSPAISSPLTSTSLPSGTPRFLCRLLEWSCEYGLSL